VQVVTLDMGLLVAGTKYRGEFEERLKKLMDEIKQNDDIILVRPAACTLSGGKRMCFLMHDSPPLAVGACNPRACVSHMLAACITFTLVWRAADD
jgi:hypothetical protein